MHHLDDILGCSLAGTVSKNFFFVSAGNSQPEAARHGAKSEIVVVLSKMTITSDLPLASNSLYSKVWVKKLAHAKPWPGGGGGSACTAHWRSSRKTTLVNFHHPSISEAPTLVKSRLVKNPL